MTNVVTIEAVQNVEAEAMLLGALMIQNDLVAKVRPIVKAEDFYEPLHGRIYAAIVDAVDKGKVCTPVLLNPMFAADPAMIHLTTEGKVPYLARLTADGSGLAAPVPIAEQIRDLGRLRRSRDIVNLALNPASALDRGALLEQVKEALFGDEDANYAECFEFLTLGELRKLPPPDWLIHEMISADGLSIIYGEPGAGKSFMALDLALRVALGMDWHGTRTRQTGVLYIAGEGVRGLAKRVDGWALHHGINLDGVPFAALTLAPQLLEAGDRAKLIRTIDEIKRKLAFDVGLTILDTVSRSIAGQDENAQETMSAFVKACDEVKAHTGGAMIGIHHCGKDRDRGMRGSTVLLGACDATLRLSKEDGVITLETEKQKDAEEGSPVFFELNTFAWNTGSPEKPGLDLTTLIPTRRGEPETGGAITRDKIARAFGLMVDAWVEGKPLSNKPQSRETGRYAPQVFALKIGGEAAEWKDLVGVWLVNGAVAFEVLDRKHHVSGLRVINPVT